MKTRIALAALTLAALAWAPAASWATQLDRSGEETLKKLLASHGALKDLRINLRAGERPTPGRGILSPSTTEVYYRSQTVFRVEATGWGGGGVRTTSDGKAVLRDGLVVGGTVELTDPKKTVLESARWLGGATLYAGTLYLILEGEQALEKLAPKDGFVKEVTDGELNGLMFGSPNAGVALVWWKKTDPKMLLVRIDYRSSDRNMEEASKKPFGDVLKQAHSGVEIQWMSVGKPLPNEVFSTATPDGTKLNDRRGKGGDDAEGGS